MLHSSFVPSKKACISCGHLPRAHHRYAFSTLLHNDHEFTCQSACHARYARKVGGRRLFPRNCSNAVDKASSVGTEDAATGERRAGGGIVCV
jgi:hypothetical protein